MEQEPTLPFFYEEPTRPLADRLRPTQLEDVVGQDHLLAPDAPLGRMVAQQRLGSAILWGPPGVGKTTIARLLADSSNLAFEPVSATFSGVAELRKVLVLKRLDEAARIRWEIRDDIHEAFLTLGCALICWRRLNSTIAH